MQYNQSQQNLTECIQLSHLNKINPCERCLDVYGKQSTVYEAIQNGNEKVCFDIEDSVSILYGLVDLKWMFHFLARLDEHHQKKLANDSKLQAWTIASADSSHGSQHSAHCFHYYDCMRCGDYSRYIYQKTTNTVGLHTH